MVKHKKGRRKFNLRKVRYEAQDPLLTTGNRAVATSGLTGTSANAYRAVSLKGTWTLNANTPGEGPYHFGYAHSDYSDAEIKEWFESQLAIDQGDKIAQEKANRLIRQVGSFTGELASEKFNEGRVYKTRLNWAIGIGDAVNVWVYNDSGASLTTGTLVDAQGVLWVKD